MHIYSPMVEREHRLSTYINTSIVVETLLFLIMSLWYMTVQMCMMSNNINVIYITKHTIYTIEYAHGFMCLALLCLYKVTSVGTCFLFTHMCQGFLTGIRMITSAFCAYFTVRVIYIRFLLCHVFKKSDNYTYVAYHTSLNTEKHINTAAFSTIFFDSI